jgi:hypothetical protein
MICLFPATSTMFGVADRHFTLDDFMNGHYLTPSAVEQAARQTVNFGSWRSQQR